ncbi:unnamed protein product [Adineta steineri]|uniref:Uncharacterized protein n=1 Tax=Adineta steineri TaxID=433720 RepID=A0A819H7M3_9BILA|nr:unnamed protein product [Adineta steineri]
MNLNTTTSITNSTETISTTIESAITSSSTTTTTSSITSSTTTTTSTSTTSSTTSSSTSSTTSSSTSSTTSTTTSSTTTSSTTSTTTTSTSQISSTVTDSSALVTSSLIKVRSFGTITRAGDPIVGIYNTSAGMSTGCINGSFSSSTEMPPEAIDNLTSTKYLNFGSTGGFGIEAPAPGVDTGFYVTPTISDNSIATALLFATANDSPNRDPITVTLEGSNSNALDIGSSWTLIYSGSTGIDPTIDPGRQQYVTQQNFSNAIAYKSYRLLITSQRGSDWAVQYSEAQIIGYY